MIVLSNEKASAVLAAILVSVCLCGCAGDVEWSDTFPKTAAQVVGFVDDSLVIVYDYQRWRRNLGSFIQDHGEECGIGHQRLRVFNYRIQEDGPRWADTLDNADVKDFNYVRGQLSDSVVWGGDPKTTVSFWKIGEKPHKMKIRKMFSGCSIEIPYTAKLRTWLGGKILVIGNRLNPDTRGFDLDSLGSEYCQYAVLDTLQKTVTYKRLQGDLTWTKKCDDVRAWGDDVLCLRFDKIFLNAFVYKNDAVLDSMMREDYEWDKYTTLSFMGNILNMGGCISSIAGERVECHSSADLIGLMFRNIGGNLIVY